MSWVVDQDEFAEVELVGESLPFGLVQDAFVVVVSGSKVCVRMLTLCSVWVCVVCVCETMPACNAYGIHSCSCDYSFVASMRILRFEYLI